MSFRSIWIKSWRDLKTNFNNITKANILFTIIPFLVVFVFLAFIVHFSGVFSDIHQIADIYSSAISNNHSVINVSASNASVFTQEQQNKMSELAVNVAWKVFLSFGLSFILIIIAAFISLLGYLCIMSVNGKENFKDLLKRAKARYWGFVGLCLLLSLISIGLMLGVFIIFIPLFLIVAIFPLFILFFEFLYYLVLGLFIVRFIFAPYYFVSGKGVTESISSSWKLVTGRWFKTYGYCLLLILIYSILNVLVYLLISGISILFFGPIISSVMSNTLGIQEIFDILVPLIVFAGVMYFIYILLLYLFIVPFIILFLRNLFLELKSKR